MTDKIKDFESHAITVNGFLTRDEIQGAYQLWAASDKPVLKAGYWIGGTMIGSAPNAHAARYMLGIRTQLAKGELLPVSVRYHIEAREEA